ncbi:hypothetical protein NP493_80g05003 [Ridgeia piscesae]|uniref:Transglutaminase-like domain-containing protein n=1 Tax=Ridgeia piscesae TaxID=27915 RepID=A0AAD9UIG3_RIDPI|nr:hypothetical protein NP493_80g05003 [Ridgeia piscesae]
MTRLWVDGGVDVKAMAQALTATTVKKQNGEMMSLLNKLQDDAREIIDMEVDVEDRHAVLAEVKMVPSEVPEFSPPTCRKRDLYQDTADFNELDDYVCSVAAKEQTTFTELVVDLTQNCESDLKKVRAIFRWITTKDLSVLGFKEGLGNDTAMGLLRGIKYGTEKYHTLFMRLCSYAGIPCVDIKGHAKLVGYEPGMKITEDTFRNTWNAVLIGGNWWPVQCEWGAR